MEVLFVEKVQTNNWLITILIDRGKINREKEGAWVFI